MGPSSDSAGATVSAPNEAVGSDSTVHAQYRKQARHAIEQFCNVASEEEKAYASFRYKSLFAWLQALNDPLKILTDSKLIDAVAADAGIDHAIVLRVVEALAKRMRVQAITMTRPPGIDDYILPVCVGFFSDEDTVNMKLGQDVYKPFGAVDHERELFIPFEATRLEQWSAPWFAGLCVGIAPPFDVFINARHHTVLAELFPDDAAIAQLEEVESVLSAEFVAMRNVDGVSASVLDNDDTLTDQQRWTLRQLIRIARLTSFRLDAQLRIVAAKKNMDINLDSADAVMLVRSVLNYIAETKKLHEDGLSAGSTRLSGVELLEPQRAVLSDLLFRLKTLLASPAFLYDDFIVCLSRIHGVLGLPYAPLISRAEEFDRAVELYSDVARHRRKLGIELSSASKP